MFLSDFLSKQCHMQPQNSTSHIVICLFLSHMLFTSPSLKFLFLSPSLSSRKRYKSNILTFNRNNHNQSCLSWMLALCNVTRDQNNFVFLSLISLVHQQFAQPIPFDDRGLIFDANANSSTRTCQTGSGYWRSDKHQVFDKEKFYFFD